MRTAVLCCLICGLVVAISGTAVGADGGLPLRDGYRQAVSFPTGGYWPWERMPAAAKRAGVEDKWVYARSLLQELKTRHHWNMVWVLNIGLADAQQLLTLADEIGIAIVVEPVPITNHFLWQSHADPAAYQKTAEQTFQVIGQHPSLAGYVLVDEPNGRLMGFLENMRRALQALDPTRPCLAVTMVRDTDGAAYRTGLPILVTDCYPFAYPRDPNLPNTPTAGRAYYRQTAQSLGAVAAATGRRPWIMPQIFQDVWGLWYYDAAQNVVAEPGAYLHWRMPTLGETRWQIWTGLVSNVKGVLFYVLFPPHNPRKPGEPQAQVQKAGEGWPTISQPLVSNAGDALLYPDSKPTPQMLAASEVFGFIRTHADLLDRLQPLDAEIAYASSPVVVRSFLDPQTGEVYAMVQTDETDRDTEATVTFLPPLATVRDLATGRSLEPGKDPQGHAQVRLPLRAGDGALLALGLAGKTRPALVLTEDFSLTTVPHALTNARRIVSRKSFGMGWDYSVVSERGTTDPAEPGRLTCQLVGTPGNPRGGVINSYPKGATLYAVYDGSLKGEDQESLVLAASTDGTQFTWLATGIPSFPVQLPATVKALRFELKPGAELRRFDVLAVPNAPTGEK